MNDSMKPTQRSWKGIIEESVVFTQFQIGWLRIKRAPPASLSNHLDIGSAVPATTQCSCGSGNETHVASLDKSHERYMICSISDVYFILHTKLRLRTLSQCKRNMHMVCIYIYIHIKYVGVCICGGIIQLSKIEPLQLTEDSVSQHKKVESK